MADLHAILGKKYRDVISGAEGVATARSEHLHGCVRVQLEWGKDGEAKYEWFDEQRLVDVETERPSLTTARTGGPQHTPTRNDPPR